MIQRIKNVIPVWNDIGVSDDSIFIFNPKYPFMIVTQSNTERKKINKYDDNSCIYFRKGDG